VNNNGFPALLDTASSGLVFGVQDQAKIENAFKKYCPNEHLYVNNSLNNYTSAPLTRF
jgi:hypothetical protein